MLGRTGFMRFRLSAPPSRAVAVNPASEAVAQAKPKAHVDPVAPRAVVRCQRHDVARGGVLDPLHQDGKWETDPVRVGKSDLCCRLNAEQRVEQCEDQPADDECSPEFFHDI